MAKERGHRLFIEICGGSPILEEAIEHLNLYRDSGKRLQELFRACVSAGCVMDDAIEFGGNPIEDVSEALKLIECSSSEERIIFRFRLHNDEEDSCFPGFSERYLKLSRTEKRIYVTRMYLLGFWFFTRFSRDYASFIPADLNSGGYTKKHKSMSTIDQTPTTIEVNDEAAELLGGLDICV